MKVSGNNTIKSHNNTINNKTQQYDEAKIKTRQKHVDLSRTRKYQLQRWSQMSAGVDNAPMNGLAEEHSVRLRPDQSS